VVGIAMAWGVLLAVGIGWALARGGPTAREQTTVAQALPVVDQAVVRIASAATADGQAVAAISGFERVGECSVTVLRSGERYQREVTVVVTPGTEAALIERVGARLPAEYQVKVTTVGTVTRMVADAGRWVRLTGSVGEKGQVRFVADTGACRPLGDLAAAVNQETAAAASVDADANRAEAVTALTRLRMTAEKWHTYQAPCPRGGAMSTVEAIATAGVEPGALGEVLTGLGTAVVVSPDVYAYASGPSQVAVRHDADHLVVTATTACR
jgi:hypothetical protein